MRQIALPPDALKRPSEGYRPAKHAEYPLKLITPMFGGGFEARKIDPLNPIRSAAVRGHLRQWWRMIVGARYRTPSDLYKAEQELWGSAEQPGRVAVRIEVAREELDAVSSPQRQISGEDDRVPLYARLGIKKDKQVPAAIGLSDLSFTVVLSQSPTRPALTDEEWMQVQQAVSAWIQFGGVGARTRRGCGSIGLTADMALLDLPHDSGSERHSSPLTLLGQHRCYTHNPTKSAHIAWRAAVEVMGEFRQGENVGRNSGTGKKLGRSRWPEPNTIRQIVSPQRAWTHSPVPPYGFPRAEFGLPIVFQFYPDRDKGEIEPKTVILQGPEQGRLRFASPIITKAMQTAQNQYVALIVFLDSPSVSYYEQHGKCLTFAGEERFLPGKDTVSAAQVEMTTADRTTVKPMSGAKTREAFENFIQTKGFKPHQGADL